MKKTILVLAAIMACVACVNSQAKKETTKMQSAVKQKQLGGLSPEEALEYMKKTPDIVIVQVNTAVWKIEPGFTGAMWILLCESTKLNNFLYENGAKRRIPHDEMEKRYNEIPSGRPVILHCGAGVVSVPAYETLLKKRPDIPELSYVAGSPHSIMKEYNEWKKGQGQ